MNRDEIIQMARQCFISAEHEVLEHEALEFAYRIAEKEREACAQLLLRIAGDTPSLAAMIRARGQK